MIDSKRKDNNEVTVNIETGLDTDEQSSGDDLFSDEYVDRLPRAVYALSGLSDGDEFVHMIGSGVEKSNFEAVGTLIKNHLDILNDIPSVQHLEKVIEILNNRYQEIQYLAANQ